MANADGAAARQNDHEAKRRRRRKMIVYGGGGGAGIAIIAAIYFFFFSVVVYRSLQEALQEVERQHPEADIAHDPRSGYVTAMGKLEASTGKSQRIGRAAAGAFAKEFVEQPEVAMALGVPKEAEIRVTSTIADPQLPEYSIVRMQQFVDQVRLFGADISVSVRNEPTASISTIATRPETVPSINLQPAIDEAAARAAALKHYASLAEDPNRDLPKGAAVEEAETVVFDPKRLGLPGETALAWRMRLETVQVFVDARDARIIVSYDDRHSVLNRITRDCKQTVDCPIVLNEAGPVPPLNALSADAKGAHGALATAHAYFKKTFNRDGFDDAVGTGGSLPIESLVQALNFKNAQWIPSKRVFRFGVGWTTLDIAAHEYGHAVTTFGPGLIYFGESGAVSEFFSDFFAAMIERASATVPDWRIGEGLPGHSTAKPLRNMADPHNGGFDKTKIYHPVTNGGQPHHFSEVVRTTDTICGAIGGDAGCVHFNSGILNKAIVLAIDGGTFQGTTVTAIGRPKAEQIIFRTLMLGVTSTSNLTDMANGAVNSCVQLAQGSQFGITSADCSALSTAFSAVGLPILP